MSNHRNKIKLTLLALIMLVSGTLSTVFAQTQTNLIVVDGTADNAIVGNLDGNGTCDLREAIEIANNVDYSNSGDCTVQNINNTIDDFVIRFDFASGSPLTINLQDVLNITSTVDISGNTASTNSTATDVVLTPAVAGGTALNFGAGADGSLVTGMTIENFGVGIEVNGANNVQIGATGAGLANYIYSTNNPSIGIVVSGVGTSGTVIQNNSAGVTEGLVTVGHTGNGIQIENGAQNTTISGNVVGGSTDDGISVTDATGITISGNFVGLVSSLSVAAAPNGVSGISVTNSSGVNITSNTVGHGLGDGIVITSSPNTTLTGNGIGTSASNTAQLLGNTGTGIIIDSSDNTTINNGAVFNNGGDGIFVNGSTGVQIQGALISNNGGNGISTTGSTGVRIQNILTSNNTGLGIDINDDGVTANDAGDIDGVQNYPVFATAELNTGTGDLVITGNQDFNGADFTTYYYLTSAGCDVPANANFGEGPAFLTSGGGAYTSAAGAGALGELITDTNASVGDYITAVTVNNTTGSTSEFAECIVVTDATLIASFVPTSGTFNIGTTATFTNTSTGTYTQVRWYINGVQVSTATNLTTTFNTPGTYTIRLEIDDNNPLTPTSFAEGTIIIVDPDPPTPVPPNTSVPNTSVPNTSVPPTLVLDTPIPTETLLPPTITLVPTSTVVLPTPTSLPTSTLVPTSTVIPPTLTSLPTITLVPASTVLPPTLTTIPTLTLLPRVTGTPDLRVTVTGNGDDEMSVFVINVGENPANNVQVQEILREGVEFRAAVPGDPICTEVGGIVSCRLGIVGGGDSTGVGLQVQTAGQSPDSGITIVTADGVAPQIIDEPFISKIGNPPVAPPGSDLTYIIRVVNPTQDSAFDMVITDIMPDIIEIMDANATAGVLDIDGQNIRLEIDELAPGERVILTIDAFVREDIDADEITNTACVSSTSNPNPNCAIMSFLAVGTLPNSGEVPLWVQVGRWLALLGGVLIVGAGTYWQLWRRGS